MKWLCKFILFIFRGRKHNGKVEADDPFVNQEDLHNYCSLFSPDGIPSNIRGDPYLAEIINFSEESLNDIAQVLKAFLFYVYYFSIWWQVNIINEISHGYFFLKSISHPVY